MKTYVVPIPLHINYLQKAAECWEEAQIAQAGSRWNAAVVNAVHTAISAADALCVFYKGVRSAGDRHEDVLTVLRSLGLDREQTDAKARQLQRVLQIKNTAEYEEKLMSATDAENALRDTERFFSWVKEKLGRK